MDNVKVEAVELDVVGTDGSDAVLQLGELQLAMVGGGIADVIAG